MSGHHHHDHAHDHAAHSRDWRYGVGIALNLTFVGVEAVAGVLTNSTALLADAGHNLSDVLGLALAGGAAWLSTRSGGPQRTYGFAKATVLASLANALILIFACGAIALAAVQRFNQPADVATGVVIWVAAAGVVINGLTAWLFIGGHDVNERGAFLHMAGDAAVSFGVIVAAIVMQTTGWLWLDPATSLVIVAAILLSGWRLLRESLDLALDAAPRGKDVAAVRAFLAAQPGVLAVHDLHIWAISARETALTAHIVRPGSDDAVLRSLARSLEQEFGIGHATLQIEAAHLDDCPSGNCR